MKWSLTSVLFLGLLVSSLANAETIPAGASSANEEILPKPNPVQEILQGDSDGQSVQLVGKLKQKVDENTYVFADETGEIEVDINPAILPKKATNPDSIIEITGLTINRKDETPKVQAGFLFVRTTYIEEITEPATTTTAEPQEIEKAK